MYKKHYTFGLLLLSILFCSLSQVSAQNNNVRKSAVKHRKLNITPNEESIPLEENYLKVVNEKSFTRNDSLYVDFQLLINGKVVKSGESLSLIPEYQMKNDAYELPAILINGKKRVPYYKRERKLTTPENYWEYKPYTTVVAKKNKDQQVAYKYALPLPGNIEEGKLILKHIKQDCCDINLEETDTLALAHKGNTRCNDSGVKLLAVGYTENPNNAKTVNYIAPTPEQEKIRQDTIRIRINYPVDKAQVLVNYKNNANELGRVDELFSHFYTAQNTYTLLEGKITGYASPEAPYYYNLKLSKRRANGFYAYFREEYSGMVQLPKIAVVGAGEDWDGLVKAVKTTDMKYKNKVLRIIRNNGIFKGREKKLMDLAGGTPYRYMLKNLFAPLRRIELIVTYRVRSFTTEEAKKMVQKRPKDLSQKEIYDIAIQTDDSQLIEKAVTYFPNDITANINASSAALIDGDLDKAYTYLQKVWNEPKAFNNIGVYYTLKKEYTKARAFFTKALGVDKTKAEANLKLLNEIDK